MVIVLGSSTSGNPSEEYAVCICSIIGSIHVQGQATSVRRVDGAVATSEHADWIRLSGHVSGHFCCVTGWGIVQLSQKSSLL